MTAHGGENRQRRKHVLVRLSDEEHSLLLGVAEHLGLSAASALRYTFMAEYGGIVPVSRPGVLAVAAAHDRRWPVAECASCERVRPIFGRGLCNACRWKRRDDGTIGEYGYVKADRIADYARLRGSGYGVYEAAERIGVSRRTAERYEASLRDAGEAPWRAYEERRRAA